MHPPTKEMIAKSMKGNFNCKMSKSNEVNMILANPKALKL